jgi:serine/threonine-protein kinase
MSSEASPTPDAAPLTFRRIDRYALFGPIAAGGMATVHYGRLLGSAGFSRLVAIKRPHASMVAEGGFAAAFVEEARLAARVRHPNVVAVLDVVQTGRELLLVMEYVHGAPLSELLVACRERGEPVSPAIAASVIEGVLLGLHAAHEAVDEGGRPLGLVHRDVSPHNVMVGVDGVARVVDFGIAKATERLGVASRQLKGKLAYMAPEQLAGAEITRQVDVYAAAVVLWEMLAGRRLFAGGREEVLEAIVDGAVAPLELHAPDVAPELARVVDRGLARHPRQRFATAREMAQALERAVAAAPAWRTGEWVEDLAATELASRARAVERIEAAVADDEVKSAPADAPSARDAPGSAPTQEPDGSGRLGRASTDDETAATRTAPHELTPATTARSARPPPTRVRPAALFGLAVLALLAALLWWRRTETGATVSPLPSASSLHGVAAAVPGPPSAPPAAPVVSSSPASPSAPAFATTPVDATPSTRRRAPPTATSKIAEIVPPTTPAPPPPAPAPPAKAAERCNPAYWVDPQGIRHLKPECM